MKYLITILLVALGLTGLAQTTPFNTFTPIPVANADLPYKPEGGAEQWTAGQNMINIPVQGTNTQRSDAYYRFSWSDFQPSNGSPNVYNWGPFDAQVNDAISKGQMFSFGVMYNCCSGPNLTGVSGTQPVSAACVYPAW